MFPLAEEAYQRGCGDECHRNPFSYHMKHTIILLFICLAVVGCEKASVVEAQAKDAGANVALEVNGIRYSGADIEREVAFRTEIVRHCRPKAKLEKAESRIRKSITNELCIATLFETAAKARDILADAAVTNKVLTQFQSTFAKGKKKGLPEFESHLSKVNLTDVYTNNLQREMAREAYVATVHGKELNVSEKDVDDLLQRIKDYNAMASATNALAYAKATNLWNQIKAGADFATLADNESEDPDRQPGGELGNCEEVDFAHDPGYWEKVSKLKAGEVSGIITTDVGLEIVKALSELEPNEQTGVNTMKLARIYIRRPMFHPDWSREETRQELEADFREEAMKESLAEVASNATIVINGKKLNTSPKAGDKNIQETQRK